VLSRKAGDLMGVLGPGMLVALSLAALGSGAAILRAMASAIRTILPSTRRPGFASAAGLMLGAMLTSRDQGIVQTMVSVNIIYLASIGVCFVALLANIRLPARQARATLVAGFVVSGGVYVAGWWGLVPQQADSTSLLAGLATSFGVAVGFRCVASHRGAGVTKSCH
jgi:SSS family solute:Na+ symporter